MLDLKKKVLILLICFLCVPITSISFAADTPIVVYIDGKKISFNVDPVNSNGTTLVQFRPVFEALGLSIGWDQKTNTVTGAKDGLTIKLTIGDKVAYVNDNKQNLILAPRTIKGSTFVPLRFIGEATGDNVTFKNNVVEVISDGIYSTSTSNYLGDLKDGKADGQGKIFDSKGKLIYEGEFKDGKKEGKGIWYRGDGKYEGIFKDGSPNGQFIITYNVPEKKDEGSFLYKSVSSIRYEGGLKGSKFDGKGTTFYDNGSKVVANYNNGELDGEYINYNSEGQITGDSYFVNGKLSGVSKIYADGVLSIQKEYVDGKETGIYTQYDKNGKIIIQVEKKDGVVVREIVTPKSSSQNGTSTPSTTPSTTPTTTTPTTTIKEIGSGYRNFLKKDDKVYLLDTSPWLYKDNSGNILVNEFSFLVGLMSIYYNHFTVKPTQYPNVDGYIEVSGGSQYISTRDEIRSETDWDKFVIFHNEDNTKQYEYSTKSKKGVIEANGSSYLPMNLIFQQLGINCTIQFDDENKKVFYTM